MTLLIESLDLTLSNKTIVKNVDLNVKPGEVVGLLGPNGAGKTSTFNLIMGLIKPNKGNIYLEGNSIKRFSMTRRVQLGIGYLPQEPSVFRNLTVIENLDIALSQAKLSISLFRKKREELIEEFNLVSFLDRFGHQLSGGERRRCEVARALAVEPKVLLLDEPLSALDLKLRQKMRTELRAIQQRVGITFIYITHDQGEALTMSDRVGVMNDGELEQVGSCYDVYEAPCTPFVATFVGENNAFYGKVEKVDGGQVKVKTGGPSFIGQAGLGLDKKNYKFKAGDEVIMFVRPEAINLKGNSKKAQNSFSAEVKTIEFEGNLKNIFLRSAEDVDIRFSVPSSSDTSGMEPSKNVSLFFSHDNAVVLPTGALALD